jgi:hypothetical protein
MGLASEMKTLSEEILSSFKNRIKENEELVNDVQKTLDGFRHDHQEMAAVLKANANALRKDLSQGEKERMASQNELMAGIRQTIGTIQKEVVAIQDSTLNMITEFTSERGEMAEDLKEFFSKGQADRKQDEQSRMKEFGLLMKGINSDIQSINKEVLNIFKNTNCLLEKCEHEHREM